MKTIKYYHKNSEVLAYKKSILSEHDHWGESTYDKKGNELTYKDSHGYWSERTYDGDGNMLTYRNSYDIYMVKDKTVTKEEFENFQNKPCLGKKIIVDGIEYTLS